MRKTLIAIASLACLLWLPSLGRAQALPTAGGLGRLQIGAAFSYAIPDFWTQPYNSDPQYAFQSIGGVTGFGDYYITSHFGLEGDFHCLALITSLDRAELTYLVGPRITLPYGRFILYGKAMGGIRDLFIQEQQDNIGVPRGSNIGFSLGGGLDVQYNQKIVIRAIDYESQSWPGYGTNGISPSVFTFGVAYRFH
jgi:opacity protein-like surface antigen